MKAHEPTKESIDFEKIERTTNRSKYKPYLIIVANYCGYDFFPEMIYDEHILRNKTATQISKLINRKYKEYCKKEGIESIQITSKDSIRYFLEKRMGIYKPLRTFKKKPLKGALEKCHVPGCNACVAPGNYWLCHQHAKTSEEIEY